MTLRTFHQGHYNHQQDHLQFNNMEYFSRERDYENKMNAINSLHLGENIQNFHKQGPFKAYLPEERVLKELDQNYSDNYDYKHPEWKQNHLRDRQSHQMLDMNLEIANKRKASHTKDTISVLVKQNQEESRVKNIRSSRFGSIKKNKKLSSMQTEGFDNQFLQNINFDDMELIRMSKLTEMNQKLNRVLYKENTNGNTERKSIKQVFSSRPLRQFDYQNDLKQSKESQIPNLFPQSLQVGQVHKKAEQPTFFNERPNPTPYIEALFNILDEKKLGKLSKSNCHIEKISQEFKFIFGGVFTKIFLKNLVCSQGFFVKLCHNVLRQIDSDEVFHILKKISITDLSNSHLIEAENEGRSSPSFCQKQMKIMTEGAIRDSDIKSMKYRRQSIQITESNLKEQRKSIRELAELSKKLSDVLDTQQLCTQNDEFEEQSSLRFDELVKFI